jgi:uncharacterized metal-binding protein
LHLTLSDYGVKKRKHADFDPAEAERVFDEAVQPAVARLQQCGVSSLDDARGSGDD